ncbi:8-amino-7-oxononanoate synthase [Niveibacterium sp. 24ML]|uniref:8-amino-7-oxononanoate synthase n=1 Tax=Niveibacterium sp. 24ML TaxID=2985512 RepID=UPI0022704124|nr:8-amino-7-oxononanoate synthase [Niveibacterium sp. 24ML]MCX9155114.1 8-amino-7-oxononanoate synthase [Niveibacterium sp. 24ML]
MPIWDRLGADIAELDAAGLRRRRRTISERQGSEVLVDGRRAINFCANDYLSLADHPALTAAAIEGARHWGVGSGASHLVSGHFAEHEAAEKKLAALVGCEAALLFSTGYMANSGVMPALVGRGDAIFADRLNHASLVDGALLSRADLRRYPHADTAALERMLGESSAPRKLIVTDSVFSMDGDIAPLRQLFELAERFDTWLLIDDAHGFGILGPHGGGALRHFGIDSPRVLYIGTLGKAAGVSGAFVAGAHQVVEWILQKARTYIFTTGSPPLLAAAICAAADLVEASDDRRMHVAALIRQLRTGLRHPERLLASDTPIQPLIVGSNTAALALAAALFEEGLWVPAIRPPTVPQGSARLRISLSAAHRADQVDALVAAINRHSP